MVARGLTLLAGVVAGLLMAQFPAFSQQYTQRLGGAADALAEVVADFDATAQASGLAREAALAEMRGTAFLERRQSDMRRSIARFETLRGALSQLEDAGPFTRAYVIVQTADRDIFRRTLAAFRPVLPMTAEGLMFALAGFAGTYGVRRLGRILMLRRRTA